MLKHKNKKKIKRHKRKTKRISLFGKLLSLNNQNGLPLGVKEGLVGTFNAQLWLCLF